MKSSLTIAKALELCGLTPKNAHFQPDCGGELDCEFDLSPTAFLEAAESAFERGEPGYVDVVSNCQRAIRCQIDYALSALGFTSKKRGIKEKVELLGELGLVTPRILERVTAPRNLMEHEYKRPNQSQVSESLDIAALFVEASNRVLHNYWGSFALEEISPSGKYATSVSFHFREGTRVFEIYVYVNRKERHEFTVNAQHADFMPLQRLAVITSRYLFRGGQHRIEEAVRVFFSAIK